MRIDFTLSDITISDFNFKKNNRFIATCSHSSTTSTLTLLNFHITLKLVIKSLLTNATDSTNTVGSAISEGYNGTFIVAQYSK